MSDVKVKPIDADAILATVEHFVCCHDTTKTYCGLTIPADTAGWTNKVDCAACMAVDAMTDATFCPVGAYCTHEAAECDCPYDDEDDD